jgi:hypothetical protein
VSPSSITLVQGGSAQSVAVTLTRTNFTGSVSLSASGLPTGVTPSYTQPGTGNSGSISLTAASSATLVSGQPITITASGSGVGSVSSSFSLTVSQAASIAISSVSPSSITLVQGGGTQTITVNLTRTNYTGSVTLSTSTLPSGVTATFTQPGTGNSGSISLTAASNATLVSGQSITITASGSGVSSVTSSFGLTATIAPTLTGLSLPEGPVQMGLVVSGMGFAGSEGNTTITVNGATADVLTWSTTTNKLGVTSTSFTVQVPSKATLGPGSVVAGVNGLSSNGLAFTVTSGFGCSSQ